MTSAGVTSSIDLVTADGAEVPIPLGEPVHMGRLVGHGSQLRVEPANEAAMWQQKTRNALDHEGIAPKKILVG